MATQLFLLDTAADTHRGTNTAMRNGTASAWNPVALSLTRGSTLRTNATASTVTGPTNGVEVQTSSAPDEWISPPVSADVTISGTITANIWASENNMSANVAINVIVDIIRATDNSIQNIVQSTFATELAVTTAAVNNFTTGMTSGAYTGQTLNRGDRLRIRVIGDDSTAATMASGFSFTVDYNGATAAADGDSYVTFTETITFESATPGVQEVTDHSFTTPFGNTTTEQQLAESFTVPAGLSELNEVRVWLNKSGSPTDNFVLEIQTDSSGSPSGSVVGTVATVAASSFTTTLTQYTYSTSVTLTASTTYWLVFRRSGALDAANLCVLGCALTALFPGKRYNGTAWNTHASPGTLRLAFTAPTPTTLYLTDTASAVATASVDREAWTSRGAGVANDVTNTAAGWTAPIQVTDTAGGTVVDWFTRPLTAFTLGGMAVANLRALESNVLARASLKCEVARVNNDGTSPSVWATWCIAPTSNINFGELTTSEAARTANVSGDDLAISDGQRLRIRIYIDDSSGVNAAMGASQTVTFYYAGTSAAASGDSYITFPQTLTEYTAPGATTVIPVGFAVGRDY